MPGRVADAEFALNVGIRALQFLDEYFQLPYPLPKCDMMSVPEFAAGAMENWGLVTYRESAIVRIIFHHTYVFYVYLSLVLLLFLLLLPPILLRL